MKVNRPWAQVLLVALAVTVFAGLAGAQLRRRGMVMGGESGGVNLPYLVNDNAGNQWRIYQGGWLQQQGNMPVYSQGAMLMIDGNQVNQNNNQAKIDDKTGELVLEDTSPNGLAITRRILFNKEQNYCRYIDVFKNTSAQEVTTTVMIQTNLNYGVNSGQMIPDLKKKDHNLAWIGQTGANVSAIEVFGGKNAKNVPTISWPQGNNVVQASMPLTIPAGKQQAIMHLHSTAATQEAGTQFVNGIKETALMRTIPPAIRKLIVNFVSGGNFVGEVEILRGDLLDVVELRSGDQFKGNLQVPQYDLQTFYGPVSLPVERVIGLISVGQYRPRQLVVLADGQIIGGQLKKETIDLQLSSGQITQIPLSQVSRLGYRKRANEPEEWNFEGRPLVMLRTGERVGIRMPAAPLDVVTRYGRLALRPEQVAGIALQSEDTTVHEVLLTDGSKFSGLLADDQIEITLEAAKDQIVKIPVREMSRIQLAGKAADIIDITPTLKLTNGDLLVGTVTGTLKLDTSFDTITVNAAELKSLVRAGETGPDVQLALWDGSTVSGQLETQTLSCQLRSGAALMVPVSLLTEYSQPQPQPSAAMLQKIKAAIKDLDNDDWKQRDRASALLLSMGPVAAGVLQDLRADQPEEAQKAIDNVLKEFAKQRKGNGPSAAGTAAPSLPIVPEQENMVLPDQ